MPDVKVTPESCASDLIVANDIYSDPVPPGAGLTATVTFSRPMYASSMPTGCYAFVYSFFTTSQADM